MHGTADDTIPLQDSLDLAAATGVEVKVVPGGDHRLNAALLDTDEIVRLVDLVVERSKGAPVAESESER